MYDAIILGGGAMGTSAAYYLASQGKQVLLLEQYGFGHTNGSSHGHSRIIRRTYVDEHFSRLMPHAYELWDELGRLSGYELIKNTGGLDFGPENSMGLKRTLETTERTGVEYEVLDHRALKEKFPVLSLPDDYFGIFQNEAGVLNPYKSLEIIRDLAENEGAVLRDNESIQSIQVNSNGVVVTTHDKQYKSTHLVLACGAWTNNVLSLIDDDIKLKTDIWKLTIGYYQVNPIEDFSVPNFPIFICWEDNIFYGFPSLERSGYIKAGPHFTDEVFRNIHKRTDGISKELSSLTSDFISRTFKGVNPHPDQEETCLYTMTEDENFILDFHPKYPNILIASGFSGHGFKFTPLIGKIISDLVIKQETAFDIGHFKAQPFIK